MTVILLLCFKTLFFAWFFSISLNHIYCVPLLSLSQQNQFKIVQSTHFWNMIRIYFCISSSHNPMHNFPYNRRMYSVMHIEAICSAKLLSTMLSLSCKLLLRARDKSGPIPSPTVPFRIRSSIKERINDEGHLSSEVLWSSLFLSAWGSIML